MAKTSHRQPGVLHFHRSRRANGREKGSGELKIQYIGGPEAVKTMDQVQATSGYGRHGLHDKRLLSLCTAEVDSIKLSALNPMEERAGGAWAYLNNLHEQRLGSVTMPG